MTRERIRAVILCLIFGPFGLIYFHKKAGIILSIMTVATLFFGFAAMIRFMVDHPVTLEDIARIQAGHISVGLSGLSSIVYILTIVVVIEWLISIVWAFFALPKSQV